MSDFNERSVARASVVILPSDRSSAKALGRVLIGDKAQACPNCPCCNAECFCDGCVEILCRSCWEEHNEDAECHSCEPGYHSE